MKNKNTIAVVESEPNDGACHVNSTSKPEELAEKVTNSESGCHVNMTSKCYSLMVPSGVDGIQMTGNGLIVQKESVTADEFNTVFRNVLSIHKSSCWLLGDILLLGDRQWGNQYTAGKYEEAIMATGLSRGTIRNIVLTCKKFPVEQRHPDLSFTHHLEVATTDADPNQRVEVLQQAAKDKLTCTALRKQLKQTRFVEDDEPEDNSRPPQGEEPDRLGLLDLPERVSPDAPPMWDAMKFKQWVNKQEPEEYTAEQCAQAIKLTEDIADFYQQVLARLEELENS